MHDPPRHFWTTEEESDLVRLVTLHTHKVGIVYRIDWITINSKLKYLNMTKSALAGKWKRYQRRLGRMSDCKGKLRTTTNFLAELAYLFSILLHSYNVISIQIN